VDRSAATSGNRAGPFAIFKVVFIGYIQSFGFILSVYDAQRVRRKFLVSEALAWGVDKKHFSGTVEASAPPRNWRALFGLDGSETRPHTGGWIVSLLSRKTGGTEGTGRDCVVPAGLSRGLSLASAHALG